MQDNLHALSALQHQVYAIRASCAGYDDGRHWEAMRLAVAIHIIARDVGRNRSLLTQLGLSQSIYIPTLSVGVDVDSRTPEVALAKVNPEPESWEWRMRYCALCHWPIPREFMARDDMGIRPWLSQVVMVAPKIGHLTRDQIVASARDQDGGAHFDANLALPAYSAFTRNLTLLWELHETYERALVATIRQIAEELLGGLRRLNQQLSLGVDCG